MMSLLNNFIKELAGANPFIDYELGIRFEKLTRPSMVDGLPSWMKVRSFLIIGNSGTTGGSLATLARCWR